MEAAHEAEVGRIREVTRQQNREKELRERENSHSQQDSVGGKRKRAQLHGESGGGGVPAAPVEEPQPLSQGIGGSLLKKMGWKDGQGLGKDASGMRAPIEVPSLSPSLPLCLSSPSCHP